MTTPKRPIVFLVFQQRASGFEFQGVFSSRGKALAACVDRTYGIGPAEMDTPFPADTVDWPGWEWPVNTGEVLE